MTIKKMKFDLYGMRRFEGKVALITGGAAGIGRATADRLAAEGAHVIIADMNAESGNRSVSEIKAAGGCAVFKEVDLTDDTAVEAVGRAVNEEYPALHYLLNNAAIVRGGLVEDGGWMENWEPETRIFRGWIHITQLLTPLLKKEGGAIVNISSEGFYMGRSGLIVYDAMKGAVVSVTKSMAVEFVDYGIRVNAIAPGFIVTEMHFAGSKDPEARKRELLEKPYPGCIMNRRTLPEDVASVIAFLFSEDASYMTGQTLHVDGGRVGMNIPK